MSNVVWFSHLMLDTDLNFHFSDPDRNLSYQQKVEVFDAANDGLNANLSLLPQRMYLDENIKLRRKKLPDAFKVWNLYFSERMARIFQKFNTENVLYYPVDFFDHDGFQNLSETPYYGVAFTESFETMDFCADGGRSTRDNMFDLNAKRKHLRHDLEDGDVPLLEGYNRDLDFWVDNRVRGCLFLSGRLYQSLTDCGLGKVFKAIKCKVPE